MKKVAIPKATDYNHNNKKNVDEKALVVVDEEQ